MALPISNKYEFVGISSENIYKESLKIFKEMGIVNITEDVSTPESKTIVGFMPSIWSYGGFPLQVTITNSGVKTILELSGDIAQLAHSPLTSKMDLFLLKLRVALRDEYHYDFVFENLTNFIPKRLTNADKAMLIMFAFMMLLVFFVLLGVLLSFNPSK